ncbi:short-chain dehydrogenase/reductase [Stipitochalara longipes BDJ]|nr:short-chain dehydrogenase/reductase [Stipitochalara longipes BDJ]
MSSQKKSVLITGCSAGGIGSALAELFHRHGWLVFATARDLNKVQHLKTLGCEIILLDVTIEETIRAASEIVQNKAGGKLNMLINNAGLAYTATVLDTDINIMRKLFDINVFGVLSTTQAFAPLLLEAKGTIVNVGSMTGRIQGPYASPYGASKAALEMMSHAMRQEMEPLGLQVVHLISMAMWIIAGIVTSHCWENMPPKSIPETSLYYQIRDKAEALMTPAGNYMSTSEFAEDVYAKIIKPAPPAILWSGSMTWPPRIVNVLVFLFGSRVWDLVTGGVSGLKDLGKIVREKELEKKKAV